MQRTYGRIDREHPIGGEMSDVLGGILTRARLPWLLQHHSRVVVLALFSFINGSINIGLMSLLALITQSPAVVLLTLQAFAINRLAGIPYPLWNPVKEPADDGNVAKGGKVAGSWLPLNRSNTHAKTTIAYRKENPPDHIPVF